METAATIVQKTLEQQELDYRKPLEVCNICGEPIQKDIVFLNKISRVPVICKCRREELERESVKAENIERQNRLNNVFKNSLMDFKFKDVTFENWDHKKGSEKLYNICFKYAENFSKAKQNNIGLIIHGNPGNGKTFATACIANRLLKQGVPVICVSINSLLDRIKETYNSWGKEGEETILKSLSNADLLILDDLGTEQSSDWSITKIYNIIDYRYRNELPTIITINLKIYKLEEQYGKRTYDRILEMCTPVLNDWKSIRFEKGVEKTKTLKEILS